MSEATFTLKAIAAALGVSKQAVFRRAKRESWPCVMETCRGGKRKVHTSSALPGDVAIRMTGQKINVLHQELADLDDLLNETIGKIRNIKRRLRELR